MLLDEDPASLIANCIANFNITPDKSSLARTTSALAHLRTARNQILAKQRAALLTLSRNLAAQNSAFALTSSAHNTAAHAAEMLRLDAEQFRVAKEAKDAEIEAERCREEARSAAVAAEELVSAATGEGRSGRAEEDEMLLKLKVYRMLGIDVEADEATGQYIRAVVRNRAKGDVHVVNVDPKFSRYFYANYFWNSI